MKELGHNIFYLKTSKLDKILFKILMMFLFKNNSLLCLKSYFNRRILLRLLKDNPKDLLYIEKYKRIIDFRFFGYTISYVPDTISVGLSRANITYIQYYNKGDIKITKEIMNILNTKYHEHQQELIKQITEPTI